MARAVSCPRCNKRLPEEAQFCRRCGTGLRGRSAPVAPPPLVSTGYDSPLPAWQDSYTTDGSAVLGYEPRGKRRPKRPKPARPRAVASSGRAWWLIPLVGFLAFRACSSFNTSHRRSEPQRYFQPAPPIRITPQDRRMAPAQEDRSSAQEDRSPAQEDLSPAQDSESQPTAPDEPGAESTSP